RRCRRLGRGHPRACGAGRRPLRRLRMRHAAALGLSGARRRDPRTRFRARREARRARVAEPPTRDRRPGALRPGGQPPGVADRAPLSRKAPPPPLVDPACRLLLGESPEALGLPPRAEPTRAWAKEAIFPSERF